MGVGVAAAGEEGRKGEGGGRRTARRGGGKAVGGRARPEAEELVLCLEVRLVDVPVEALRRRDERRRERRRGGCGGGGGLRVCGGGGGGGRGVSGGRASTAMSASASCGGGGPAAAGARGRGRPGGAWGPRDSARTALAAISEWIRERVGASAVVMFPACVRSDWGGRGSGEERGSVRRGTGGRSPGGWTWAGWWTGGRGAGAEQQREGGLMGSVGVRGRVSGPAGSPR